MSNSRSPRAVRSMTIGTRGIPWTLPDRVRRGAAAELSSSRPEARGRRSVSPVQPGAATRVMRGVLAAREFGADLAEGAEALGDHVVLVDRLEVLLASREE